MNPKRPFPYHLTVMNNFETYSIKTEEDMNEYRFLPPLLAPHHIRHTIQIRIYTSPDATSHCVTSYNTHDCIVALTLRL